MYKTILVPLDLSKRAERILSHVEEIARSFSAQVIFLHIFEANRYLYESNGAFVELNMELARQQMDESKKYLDALRGEFRSKGIQTSSMVLSGPVVSKIIHVAEVEDVDLIAMASHGRTGLTRVFYGGIAAGILQRANRPLLLIRAVDAD